MKAFPRRGFRKHFNTPGTVPLYIPEQDGMDLRDYFAAKAMQVQVIRPEAFAHLPRVAERAYEVADAMMKEREK